MSEPFGVHWRAPCRSVTFGSIGPMSQRDQKASTEVVVGTLDQLGLLELDRAGPWGELDTATEDAFESDAIELPSSDEYEGALAPSGRADNGLATALNRVSQAAHREPPRPPDPDALAWYQPFHYFGHQWGVFVRQEAIEAIAENIRFRTQTLRDPQDVARDCLALGRHVLEAHEQCHHAIESAAIRLEIASRSKKYSPYDLNVFRPTARTPDWLEEGVATATMLDALDALDRNRWPRDVVSGARRFLRDWIPTLPDGYSEGLTIADHGTDKRRRRLLSQLDEASKNPIRDPDEWLPATHLTHPLHTRRSRRYIVVPRGGTSYWQATGDKKLSIDVRELVSCLERLGFERVPSRGRHPLKLTKPGFRPIPVPVHSSDLKPGTAHSIAVWAGFANVRDLVSAASRA